MSSIGLLAVIPWLLLVVGVVLAIMTLWQLYRYLSALTALKEGEVLAMRRRMLETLQSNASEKQS